MSKRKKKKVPTLVPPSIPTVHSSSSTTLNPPSIIISSLKSLNEEGKQQVEKKEKDKSEIAFQEKLKGDEDFLKGDYQAAEVKYSKGIAFSPHNKLLVSLLTNRAITNLILMEYEKAESDCCSALELNQNNCKVYCVRSIGKFYSKQFKSAYEDLDKARSLAGKKEIKQMDAIKEHLRKIENSSTPSKQNSKKMYGGVKWLVDSGFIQLDREDKITSENNSSNIELETNPNVDLDCPALVPIGESLSEDGSTITYLEIPNEEAEKMALEEKKKGNESFGQGDYLQAITHYSKAIRLNSRDYIFFSNRAACYLKLGRFLECISDCTASIERNPNIKAFVRRAHAWESIGEYLLASDDFKKAVKFEKNPATYSDLNRCLKKLEQEFIGKLQADPTSDKLKKSLQTVREDIKHLEEKLKNPTKNK